MAYEVVMFDNSGLSRLFEEQHRDRAALVAGLQTIGALRISALNVYETARTPDPAVRWAKLRFYAALGGNVAPISDPMALLGMLASAWRTGSTHTGAADELAHQILVTPELAGDELREAMTIWSKQQERDFAEMHLQVRTAFDAAYVDTATRWQTETDFMQMMFAIPELVILPLIAQPFNRWTGTDLAADETAEFLAAVPVWRVFVGAQLHALWLRAANEEIASWRKTGIFDTDSAAYLPLCDRFITNDRAQVSTLMAANAMNPRPTCVQLYDNLRSYLLL